MPYIGNRFLRQRTIPPSIKTMGLTLSSIFSSITSLVRWNKDQDVRILMLGLDSAGKVCPLFFLLDQCAVPHNSCRQDHYSISVTGMIACLCAISKPHICALRLGKSLQQYRVSRWFNAQCPRSQSYLSAIGFNVETVQVALFAFCLFFTHTFLFSSTRI
jgi:hypothetical protein